MSETLLRRHARSIWQAAVDAVRPGPLVRDALADPSLGIGQEIEAASRILVFGGGKAGSAMAEALEASLASVLDRVEGWVNVPAGSETSLKKIHLHPARPAGSNHPTEAGVVGASEILRLARSAEERDIGLCLLSGGGSALLPMPAEGLTLADKQAVTKLLHACGATIHEMNAVRKHLSGIKGGRLAQEFRGKQLFTLIISDVVGDPLDVIASGPTAPDPSTFHQCLEILDRYSLTDKVPAAVLNHLRRGERGEISETAKSVPANVRNIVLGNNRRALTVAETTARSLGYQVLNLGSFVEGETATVATVMMGIAQSIRADGIPLEPPVCILCGGETTVTLDADHGLGGRNQEFVLASLLKLKSDSKIVVLSGGTDGEDGPTDAAGAIGDSTTLVRAGSLGLRPAAYLRRHDAYEFFQRIGDLLITGLTQTNVMDVRVILIPR